MFDLAAIEKRNADRHRLRDAATPGPWRICYGGLNESDEGFGVDSKLVPGIVAECWPPGADLERRRRLLADSQLIVAARTDTAVEDIAALVKRIRELEPTAPPAN